jgi:hypothetical protein
MSTIPQSLYDLRQQVLALQQEAKDLRAMGRAALAISVEREAREAQTRFEKAAVAYKALNLI